MTSQKGTWYLRKQKMIEPRNQNLWLLRILPTLEEKGFSLFALDLAPPPKFLPTLKSIFFDPPNLS